MFTPIMLNSLQTGFTGSAASYGHAEVQKQSINAVIPARRSALVQAEVLAMVLGAVTAMLGVGVSPDQPLMDAGLDSLGEKPCSLHWPDVLVFVPQPVMFGYCRCYGASDVLGHDIRS